MAETLRNDFKPFAVNPTSEVMPQYQWDEGTLRRQGHVPGLASPFLANKAERQGTLGAASIGELINRAGLNAIDDGDVTQIANALQAAVIYMAQKMLFDLLSGTAPNNESVLIGFDPVSEALFGYPMDRMVLRALRLSGGDAAMESGPDGSLSGGDATTVLSVGIVSGGDAFTF
jgi:hypothetical protein